MDAWLISNWDSQECQKFSSFFFKNDKIWKIIWKSKMRAVLFLCSKHHKTHVVMHCLYFEGRFFCILQCTFVVIVKCQSKKIDLYNRQFFMTILVSKRIHICKWISLVIKVRKIQNAFMRSSFLPKYQPKITKLSALPSYELPGQKSL